MRRRIAAFAAAAAVLFVSVQAGIVEACGLCPVDCPMHAEHQPGVDLPGVEKKTGAKMRCHGAADTPTADDPQWRRPPCRTSMTFSASLLPPFVLQPAPDAPVIVASRPGSGCDTCRLVGRDTPPDTPPPISFV